MRARGTPPSIDDAVLAAVAASSLRHLRPDVLERLLAGSTRRPLEAGTILRREGEPGPHLELVVDGFVRILVGAPDGRSLTIRYVRPGGLLGAVSVYRDDYRLPGWLQAIQTTDLLVIRPDVAKALSGRDLDVAAAFLDELSERVLSFVTEIPRGAFAPVRQRVARHLLDLASERQHGATLFAPISQQQLAEAVGSVREVVVRALRDLRLEGAIRTTTRGILVLDPTALWEEASGPSGWNPGS
jgi:CRP/FNR family transcriptional regulator